MFILQKMDNWLVWSLAGLRIMNNTFAPWQKKSWPLQVPFSRHFLEAEPIGSNPGEQKKEHTVLKYSNVVPVQLSRKPLVGSGRAEHVTAKRHNKWFILCSFKLQQRFRLKKTVSLYRSVRNVRNRKICYRQKNFALRTKIWVLFPQSSRMMDSYL